MLNPGKIHIGNLIDEKIKERGITKAEFGRRICTSRQNISTLLKKESLDASLLYKISIILDFNFFSCYTEKLPLSLTSEPTNIGTPRNLKRTYSLTINSDSENILEELLEKLKQENPGSGNKKAKGNGKSSNSCIIAEIT